MDPLPERHSGLTVADRPGSRPAPLPLPVKTAGDADALQSGVWNCLLGEPALSRAELAALTAVARVRAVARGQTVFRHREPAQSLVFVREGEVALGYGDDSGGFRLERPVRGPGWLDQSAAWIDGSHMVDARALTPLVVVEVPREHLQALVGSFPVLARRLIGSLAREVQSLAENTHALMHKDAPSRFAQWLIEHCQPQADGAGRGVVRLHERKRDIASQLAITPETLSRVMRSLSRQGLISVAGYTVQVADLPALQRLADEVG